MSITVLCRAWRLHTRSDSGGTRQVGLLDIHETLALLTTARNEYDLTEIGRDLLLLDESGVRNATVETLNAPAMSSTGCRVRMRRKVRRLVSTVALSITTANRSATPPLSSGAKKHDDIDAAANAIAEVVTPPPSMLSLLADAWLQQLDAHNYDRFVVEGGAAVKFAVDSESDARPLRLRIEHEARQRSADLFAADQTDRGFGQSVCVNRHQGLFVTTQQAVNFLNVLHDA